MSSKSNNLFLGSLSASLRQTILGFAQAVDLPVNYVLQVENEHSPFIYFLDSGMASVVIVLIEGDIAEVALVGHEGLANSASLIGSVAATSRCFMQVGGHGLKAPMNELRNLFQLSEEFRRRVLDYVQVQWLTTIQLSACNCLHNVEQRLSRWLLMVSDRLEGDQLTLTHDFLSQMLGVHRPTLTIAIGMLEHAGFIRNSRGKVTILDRDKLMSVACECYPVTKRLLDGLYSSESA